MNCDVLFISFLSLAWLWERLALFQVIQHYNTNPWQIKLLKDNYKQVSPLQWKDLLSYFSHMDALMFHFFWFLPCSMLVH